MKNFSIWSALIAVVMVLAGVHLTATRVQAESGFFSSAGCVNCHSAPATTTCNGCHAHGTHANSGKSTINLTGTTNKTSYAPGETVSVTIAGGYRTGWVRAILYNQNRVELAQSTGNASGMGSSTTLPAVLTCTGPDDSGNLHLEGRLVRQQVRSAEAGAGTTVSAPAGRRSLLIPITAMRSSTPTLHRGWSRPTPPLRRSAPSPCRPPPPA